MFSGFPAGAKRESTSRDYAFIPLFAPFCARNDTRCSVTLSGVELFIRGLVSPGLCRNDSLGSDFFRNEYFVKTLTSIANTRCMFRALNIDSWWYAKQEILSIRARSTDSISVYILESWLISELYSFFLTFRPAHRSGTIDPATLRKILIVPCCWIYYETLFRKRCICEEEHTTVSRQHRMIHRHVWIALILHFLTKVSVKLYPFHVPPFFARDTRTSVRFNLGKVLRVILYLTVNSYTL